MKLFLYKVKLKYDDGTVTIKTVAKDKETANYLVCRSEFAPLRSIVSTKMIKQII